MVGELNLKPDRGPNVWDEQRQSGGPPSRGRRLATGIGGAALAAAGAVAAVKGAQAVYRAAVGSRRATPDASPSVPVPRDLVNEESAASFPASDAPSWTPTAGAVPDVQR